MAKPIPFVADDVPAYGACLPVSPLIRRVVAPNPGPFTYTGTGVYIIGTEDLVVIDPGPDHPEHITALAHAINGTPVRAIVITHTHRDHSPAARPLAAITGAPILGGQPLGSDDEDGPRVDEGHDLTYQPDRILRHGEVITGKGWTLTAVATPGHASNHICYALAEEQALFTGDHVMGWSTTVVAPPDGDMAAYIASLRHLLDRDDRIYYPTHGKPVIKPKPFVRALIAHRRQRERQILTLLGAGPATIPEMVAKMYASVDQRLHGAAGQSVLAHLNDLEAQGRLAHDGKLEARLRIYRMI